MRSELYAVLAVATVGVLACARHRPRPEPFAQRAVSAAQSAMSAGILQPAPLPTISPDLMSRAAQRSVCRFRTGALPHDTLDVGAPHGSEIPIDHFIVVMQENRSFDHYFERLPAFGQPEVEVAPSDFSNPDPAHGDVRVPITRATSPCVDDVKHDWVSAHKQYEGGTMQGFLASAGGARALTYYDAAYLPYYYTLANTFAIGDHYFADVMGPTWPNRMFAIAATSFGHIDNKAPPPKRYEERSLFHQLARAKHSWVIYSDVVTFEAKIFPILRTEHGGRFKPMSEFFEDVANDRLPDVSWVESSMGGARATDEHPPANIQVGQRWVAKLVDAVIKSHAWPRSAVFIMFDEHGGFFDHVVPPPACAPEEPLPIKGKPPAIHFDRYGMRVPFFVVSPFAKHHYVSHTVLSHASILRLIQARYDLPALTRRDANAEPPFDLFKFDYPPFLTPPELTIPDVDPQYVAECKNRATIHKKPPLIEPPEPEGEPQAPGDPQAKTDPAH